jgi:hypothetical protein
MSNLLRRLQKLEARSTDRSGFPPQSNGWFAYWLSRLNRILSGEEPGPLGCIPLEVWDAIGVPDRDDHGQQVIRSGVHDLPELAAVANTGRRDDYR